jgi:hypothetical protein
MSVSLRRPLGLDEGPKYPAAHRSELGCKIPCIACAATLVHCALLAFESNYVYIRIISSPQVDMAPNCLAIVDRHFLASFRIHPLIATSIAIQIDTSAMLFTVHVATDCIGLFVALC